MVKFGSIEEILEFAIAKEEASRQFFIDMSQRMEDDMSRRLFKTLAKEELRHRTQLELELMKAGKVVPQIDNESGRTKVDYTLDEEFSSDMSYTDAIVLSMEKETASFRLYVDLMRVTENDEAIDVFTTLAEEEVRHKLQLEMVYDNITHKNS